MKRINLLLFSICLSAIIFSIASCERDDICAENTPTTPLLIIRFIDINDGVTFKSPSSLSIRSTDTDTTEAFLEAVTQDSIAIPLKTDAALTEFEFTINANSTDPANEANTDILSFQYTLEEEYVSSACGFRANYLGLTRTLVNEEGDENWIKDIKIQKENVTDETAAHIFIFH